MLTQEQKDQIKKVMLKHLDKIDILKVENYDLVKKAEAIHKTLPEIYKELEKEKTLPEEINFNNFMNIGTIMLNQKFQEAQFGGFFTMF